MLLRCHDQLILGFVGSRRSWELCGVNEGSWKICKGWQNVLEKLWPGIVLEPNNLAMRERERESYLYIIYIIYPKIKATIYKLYIYTVYIYMCVWTKLSMVHNLNYIYLIIAKGCEKEPYLINIIRWISLDHVKLLSGRVYCQHQASLDSADMFHLNP